MNISKAAGYAISLKNIPDKEPVINTTDDVRDTVPKNKEDAADKEQNTEPEKEKKDTFVFDYTPKDEFSSLYKKNRKKNKKTYYNSSAYSATSHLTRLASANSKGAVHGIIYNLRSSMMKIRYSDLDDAQIRTSLAKIRVVIKKAEFKIYGLRREEKMAEQQRIAEGAENRAYAERLAEQLRKHRHARVSRERCNTLDIDDVLKKPYAIDNEPYESQIYSPASTPQVQAVPQSLGPAAGTCVTSDTAAIPLDITV